LDGDADILSASPSGGEIEEMVMAWGWISKLKMKVNQSFSEMPGTTTIPDLKKADSNESPGAPGTIAADQSEEKGSSAEKKRFF